MNFGPWSGYKSKENPVPLTESETAILCAVANGATGIVSGDNIPLPVHADYGARTAPAPCNMRAFVLFFVNDEGTFLYKAPEPTKLWEIESPEDREKIFEWFRKNTVKVGDRLDIPLVPPAVWSSNKWDMFGPGSTVLFPVVDNTREVINGLLYVCTYEDRYKIIDDRTGKPAGCEKWIKSGWLNGAEAPLSLMDHEIGIMNSVTAGAMMQNMLLTMAAMGLAGFPVGGYTPMIVLGGTPMARGLGFHFVTDKQGIPNPVGKDGILETLCPPYKTMDEAVDTIVREKYGPDGCLSEQKRAIGPYKDYGKIKEKLEKIPEEAIACTKAIVNYAYNTYGRFPANYDTIMIPIAVQDHHVDTEFYEKYINLPLPEPVRNHMRAWH